MKIQFSKIEIPKVLIRFGLSREQKYVLLGKAEICGEKGFLYLNRTERTNFPAFVCKQKPARYRGDMSGVYFQDVPKRYTVQLIINSGVCTIFGKQMLLSEIKSAYGGSL